MSGNEDVEMADAEDDEDEEEAVADELGKLIFYAYLSFRFSFVLQERVTKKKRRRRMKKVKTQKTCPLHWRRASATLS